MFHLVVVAKPLRQRQPFMPKIDRHIPLPARQGNKGKPADGLQRNQLIANRVGSLQALPVKLFGLLNIARIPAQECSIVERVRQATPHGACGLRGTGSRYALER
jgi:hypothetical protein